MKDPKPVQEWMFSPPPHPHTQTHTSLYFFSSPLCPDGHLEDGVSWREFLENKTSVLLQVSLDYGAQSSISSKARGWAKPLPSLDWVKRLALSHQCCSLQQYSSFSFAMFMETYLGWGGNEKRADTRTEKLGSGALMAWFHLQQQPRTPVCLLCTAFIMLASQRTRSLQARYSQTVNTERRKLQLLVLNTLVNSLWTLVLAHTLPHLLLNQRKAWSILSLACLGRALATSHKSDAFVLDMAMRVLTIQIYFGLYLFLCYYYCFLYIYSGLPQLPMLITLASSVLELFPL